MTASGRLWGWFRSWRRLTASSAFPRCRLRPLQRRPDRPGYRPKIRLRRDDDDGVVAVVAVAVVG